MTGNDKNRIIIQDRDRHLLRELVVMRVIDREQAKCVAGFGSTTRANSRLLALTMAGLLRRFFFGTARGGKKAIYALSPKGAALADVPYRGPRRRQNEVLVADFFVTHQLFINQIFCEAKYKQIPIPGARFLRWVAFHKPLANTAVIPDGYFEIALANEVMAAFLEVDLGHESLRVWKAKIHQYLRYAVSGDFQNQFQGHRFRILVVAPSERRLRSIRALVASITEKIFWFTTLDSISREGFWSAIWLRPKSTQLVSLM